MSSATTSTSTPLEMFYHWEKTSPEAIYFSQPLSDGWHDFTWKQVANEVRRMTSAIKAMNLPAKSNIAIISKNCAHWIMSDLAIWMSGHVSVPLYPNLTAETIEQILAHCEAKLVFIGKLDGFEKIKKGMPSNLPCISYPKFYKTEATDGYSLWEDLIKENEPITDSPKRSLDDLSTIIYTSGTTGMPKGVMHNFKSFNCAGYNGIKLLNLNSESRFFSYLPLSHVAERMLIESFALYAGGRIFFAQSLDTFPKDLRHTNPTAFLAVPRIWTKFQIGILQKVPAKKLNFLLSIPFVRGFISNKILTGLGLADCKFAVTGAAPIPLPMLQWFEKLGLVLLEGYGLSENFGYSHFNLPGKYRFGSVGQPLPSITTRLGEADEIQMKGDSVMVGYFKEEEKTAEVFTEDGYFKTGDQGTIDSEGYLTITGRVKDIFKTSKGKYVVPSPIEMKLAKNTNIEQVCVVGVGLPQPMALAVLSEIGKAVGTDQLDAEFDDFINSNINPTLEGHEKLKKIIIMNEDWSMENKILTPTMKIKRNVIEKRYEDKFEPWYNSPTTVVRA